MSSIIGLQTIIQSSERKQIEPFIEIILETIEQPLTVPGLSKNCGAILESLDRMLGGNIVTLLVPKLIQYVETQDCVALAFSELLKSRSDIAI